MKNLIAKLLFLLLILVNIEVVLGAESNVRYFSSSSFLEVDWTGEDSTDNYSFDGQWLYGSDYSKLAILTEGDLVGDNVENGEVQFLLSGFIDDFWDIRAGIKQEIEPEMETSLVVGIEGLAPYWFDIGASIYYSEQNDVSADFEFAYDVQLTNQVIFRLYTNGELYGYNDQQNNIGRGLSSADYGIQLYYEFNRHFAIYLDSNKEKSFGNTKDYLIASGMPEEERTLRLGVKFFNF